MTLQSSLATTDGVQNMVHMRREKLEALEVDIVQECRTDIGCDLGCVV